VVVPLMTAMVVVGGQLMALSPAPPSPPRRSHRLAESRQERLCRWRFAGALGSVAGRRLFADTSSAAFTPGAARGLGYLLFVRDQTLVAQPFDPARLQPAGELFPVAEQVARANIHWGKFSITPGGVLAYSSGTSASRTQLVWFDREGKRLGVAGEPAVLGNLALSPDQKKAAFQRSDRGNQDIWVTDLERGGASRLTFDPALDVVPVWSPDGATIAYGAMRDGVLQIFAKSAAGTGREELLLKHPEGTAVPLDWSPDGRQILGAVVTPKNK